MKQLSIWVGGYFLGMGLLLSAPVQAESWQKLSVACGTDVTYFNDVAVASSRTVYAAGGGAILGGPGIICQSTDRGDNWVEKDIPFATALYAIDCRNALTCYAAGANGKLLKTINGGDSWSEYTATDSRGILPGPDPQPTFWDIRIVPGTSGNTVVAIGDLGNIWRTTNGGFSWVGLDAPAIPVDFTTGLSSVHFAGTTGWIVGSDQVLKSDDGGATWVVQEEPSGANALGNVFAINASKFWVSGFIDITRSDDGGESWGPSVVIAPGPPNIPFSDAFFIDEDNGWAVGGPGGGIVRKSVDGGITWPNLFPFTNPDTLSEAERAIFADISVYDGGSLLTLFPHLEDVDFYNADLGFIVGEDQTILRRYIPFDEIADLVPDSGWSLACANSGAYLHIIAGFRNNGPESAFGPFVVRLESIGADSNPIPGASRDYEIVGEIENGGFRTIDTIGGGAVSANELYNLFNPEASAELTIRMTVDASNNVTEGEAGEANNVWEQTTPCGVAAAPAEGEPPSGGFEQEKKPSEKFLKKKPIPKKKFFKKKK